VIVYALPDQKGVARSWVIILLFLTYLTFLSDINFVVHQMLLPFNNKKKICKILTLKYILRSNSKHLLSMLGRIIVLVLLMLLNVGLAGAQIKDKDIKFKNIGTNEGLSSPKVNTILQDSKGFLWFGTKNGLDLYDGYSIRSYKVQKGKGLPDSHIQALFEDRDGFIWIGTYLGGLCRFDRRTGTFQTYSHDASEPNSLPSNDVLAIHQDRAGHLWISTRNGGLSRFNPESQDFTSSGGKQGSLDSLQGQTVTCIMEDHDGTLWLGTVGNGLYRFNPHKDVLNHYQYQAGNEASIPSNNVFTVYQDGAGSFWVGTDQGLALFDCHTNLFKTYLHEVDNSHSLSSNFIMDIQEDALGMLWVASKGGGLSRMDSRKKFFTTYLRNFSDPFSLSSNDVNQLMLDKAGILWIATNWGGVCRFDSYSQQVFNNIVSEDYKNFEAQWVTALYENDNKDLLIGTKNHGLYLFDRTQKRFVVIGGDAISRVRNDDITGICADKKGIIWIGTASSGLIQYDRQTRQLVTNGKKNELLSPDLQSDSILTLFKDRKHNLWVGTTAGLYRFDAETNESRLYLHNPNDSQSIAGNKPKVICEDNSGLLWIGDKCAGVSVFDPNTGTFQRFQHTPGVSGGINSNNISSIVEARDGIIWIGTVSSGISKFDPRTHTFNTLTSYIGLLDNVICGLLKDNLNNIWISTPKGLSCYNGNTRIFKHYKVDEELSSNEFTQGACFKNQSGELFFGGRRNFIYFLPTDIIKSSYQAPVYLTDFKLFDQKKEFNMLLSEVKLIEMNSRDNFFSFEFALLDFLEPEQNCYTYKLEGFDKGWNYIGKRRFASYTNLDPGEYVFRVKAVGKNGTWNEEGASIRIVIHPAWYRTWWFKVLVVISLVGAGWTYYRNRIRTIEKQKRELELQVEQRTADLNEEKAKLMQAYDEINAQKEELQRQSIHITSSITYAKRIQEAMLPLKDEIRKVLPDSFILFKPRDTVSGDFYWFARKGDNLVLAVVDCTGHGIPGAFMSMIGNSLLNQVVNELNIIRPSEILRRMHHGVREALKQDEHEDAAIDGMDIGLCVINLRERTVEFAGANRPLWYVTQTGLEELKPTGGSIGGLMNEAEGKYTYHYLEVDELTNFYLFSDGYADQFGSQNNRKFMLKNFKQQLLDIQAYDFDFQREVLDKTIENWRGDSPQIDDMLVIGFRLPNIV
jgi:ligand-binding sensor domain-containing protein/serine phosphatase RsbU (regulator of sigma subunit)